MGPEPTGREAAKRCWGFPLPCLEATVSWGMADLVCKAVDKVKGCLGSPCRQDWKGGGDSSPFLSPHHETGSPVSCLLRKVWNHLSSIQCNPPLPAQSLQAPWKGDRCSEPAQKSTGFSALDPSAVFQTSNQCTDLPPQTWSVL